VTAKGGALAEPLHFADVGAQRHSEHVGAHPPADALVLQRARKVAKHLIGDVRERRAKASGGGQLCDQHRGLAYDRIDQQVGSHGQAPRGWRAT